MIVCTHDDARSLIRECAGGLEVRFTRTRDQSSASATRFDLFHPSHPRRNLAMCDVYTLPFVAETMARGVRELAAEANGRLRLELKGNQ